MPTAASPGEDGDTERDMTGKRRKTTLSTCGVCGSHDAKYRCPACLRQSCSLLCVKKHKDDSGCSGVRDKTTFVALSQFDEMNLLSDYRFLEDTGRLADGATRDKLVRTPRVTFKAKKLTDAAREMNINLRCLPATFTRSRENSTVFYTRDRRFLWHLKLIFPQSKTEFCERRVSECQTLEQILTPYIHPTESDPVRRQKLKMYAQATFDEVKVFMRAEGRRANSVRYHELDLWKSLRDNLIYKTLIEYPVLHVVLRGNFQDYPLSESKERPAEPGSCFTTKGQGEDQGTKEPTHALPPHTLASVAADEARPPKEKRAKREAAEDEGLEDGEVLTSSEEDEEEGKVDAIVGQQTPVENSSTADDGRPDLGASVSDTQVKGDEPAGCVGGLEDMSTGKDRNGDQCVDESIRGVPVSQSAAESAEVSLIRAGHSETGES